MRRRLISALLFVPVALAQPVVSARAGLVSYIEGPVSVDGQPISVTLDHVVQMKDGQVLQTERGLAEMFLSPGTVLRLGNSASVKFQTTKLADTQLSIETGTALVEVLPPKREGNRLQIRSGLSLTEVTRPGLYRFDAESKGLRVYGGEAAVHLGSKTVKVKRDRSVALTEGLAISKFNPQRDGLAASMGSAAVFHIVRYGRHLDGRRSIGFRRAAEQFGTTTTAWNSCRPRLRSWFACNTTKPFSTIMRVSRG